GSMRIASVAGRRPTATAGGEPVSVGDGDCDREITGSERGEIELPAPGALKGAAATDVAGTDGQAREDLVGEKAVAAAVDVDQHFDVAGSGIAQGGQGNTQFKARGHEVGGILVRGASAAVGNHAGRVGVIHRHRNAAETLIGSDSSAE